jgi:FKBP-type peptidyl-prolyl cis-trans isomerase SlyD
MPKNEPYMIKENHVVSINFTLKNAQGDVLDSTDGEEPLAILIGHENVIPGLEDALVGKKVGDKFDVQITAEEAYGEHDPEAIQTLPLTLFEDIDDLEIGMELMADTEDGPRKILVTAINDGLITVDGNHELAGVDLHFIGEIVEVRDGDEEEIDHGHAH